MQKNETNESGDVTNAEGLYTTDAKQIKTSLEAVAATRAAATSLYAMLAVMEAEVGVYIPLEVVTKMAQKSGELLRQEYGDEAIDDARQLIKDFNLLNEDKED